MAKATHQKTKLISRLKLTEQMKSAQYSCLVCGIFWLMAKSTPQKTKAHISAKTHRTNDQRSE